MKIIQILLNVILCFIYSSIYIAYQGKYVNIAEVLCLVGLFGAILEIIAILGDNRQAIKIAEVAKLIGVIVLVMNIVG